MLLCLAKIWETLIPNSSPNPNLCCQYHLVDWTWDSALHMAGQNVPDAFGLSRCPETPSCLFLDIHGWDSLQLPCKEWEMGNMCPSDMGTVLPAWMCLPKIKTLKAPKKMDAFHTATRCNAPNFPNHHFGPGSVHLNFQKALSILHHMD